MMVCFSMVIKHLLIMVVIGRVTLVTVCPLIMAEMDYPLMVVIFGDKVAENLLMD